MSYLKSLIRLLHKLSFIFLLALTFIMLIHMLITLFLCTTFPTWFASRSTFDAVLLVFLYYVIPLILLLFFYLGFHQLLKCEPQPKREKSQIKKTSSKQKTTNKQLSTKNTSQKNTSKRTSKPTGSKAPPKTTRSTNTSHSCKKGC